MQMVLCSRVNLLLVAVGSLDDGRPEAGMLVLPRETRAGCYTRLGHLRDEEEYRVRSLFEKYGQRRNLVLK